MEGVYQLKDLTIRWETSVAGTLEVYTDLPGGSLILRTTITLAATTGRWKRTFPLDGIEGRQLKVKGIPAAGAVLRLYDGSYRVRRIGEYIDGAAGEIWETQPLDLGA